MSKPALYRPIRVLRNPMWIERLPVTILLGAELGLMIVIPAVVNQTQPLGAIIGICTVAVAVALYFELLMLPLRRVNRPVRSVSIRSANVVLAIGVVAVVGATLGGTGNYAVQVGLAQESPLTAVFTPFTVWVIIGTALQFWLFREGVTSRSRTILIAIGVCLLQLWVGLERAVLGQSAALVLTVLVLAVFARLIRLRVVVVVLLLIPLLWPPIYNLRDTIRRESTGFTTVSADSPLNRLQLDQQMSAIGKLVPKPYGLEPPTVLTLIRTGLLPRFVDPDRPPIDTGSRMSVALGGSPLNSQSATMFGNAYIFDGWIGVIGLSAGLALAMGAAVRRRSPWALAFVALIYQTGMSFNATYPDFLPQILQSAEATLLAYIAVRLLSSLESRRGLPIHLTASKAVFQRFYHRTVTAPNSTDMSVH